MDKIWSFVIDFLIAILALFIAVLIYFGLRTETVIKSMSTQITDDFITDVKENGCFTLNDYEKYMEKLSLTDTLYDVTFEHDYNILEPEYRLRTLEEIIAAQKTAYKGENIYHYREVITEKPAVSDPVINDGSLNTETNESILAKAVKTPASSTHTHSDECYSGHKHTGEHYFIHTHQHTGACTIYVKYSGYWSVCANCGTRYQDYFYSAHWDSVSNSAVCNSTGNFNCPNCGSDITSSSEEMKISWGYSCGYDKDLNGDSWDDKTGTAQAYQYEKSYPQNKSYRFTATSGCYTYHNHVNFPAAGYSTWTREPYYTADSMSEAGLHGLEAYCNLPEYYTIDWYSHETGNLCYSVTYRAEKMSDGTFRMVFNGGYAKYKASPGSIYDSKYPAYMSFCDFATLAPSPYSAATFFKQIIGYYPNDIDSDCYTQVNCSGNIKNCDVDDTKSNQWILTCGQEEDTTPDCSKIVKSLTPTNPTQTVYTGEPLITTALATFLDGSTNTVLCHTDFDTSNIVSKQDVTISYLIIINGVTKTYSTTVNVTVIPRSRTCPNGHSYNLTNDGTDPGCPYCRAWVKNIRILYPLTSTMTITIGTTLQDNGVKLLITYFDGRTETITSGYEDNLDKTYLGTKPVTIGYKGAAAQLMVTTVCAKMTCDICGYVYDLYPDGTNPGCPKCISKTPVFTGNVLKYDEAVYTEEILEELFTDGEYRLNKYDTFIITVKNKSSTLARRILQKVIPSLTDRWYLLRLSEKIMEK